MFSFCHSLTTAPQLPATGLAQGCYGHMFSNCTGLVIAPALPATTLAYACYAEMFNGCISLIEAPELPAATLTTHCYNGMFQGCSSLTSINVNFTNWRSNYYSTSNWVNEVPQSGIFYKPAGLSTEIGISRIPLGWTVIDK